MLPEVGDVLLGETEEGEHHRENRVQSFEKRS